MKAMSAIENEISGSLYVNLFVVALFVFFFSIYLKKILRILPLKLIMRRLPDSFQS